MPTMSGLQFDAIMAETGCGVSSYLSEKIRKVRNCSIWLAALWQLKWQVSFCHGFLAPEIQLNVELLYLRRISALGRKE
jgi:hypothetical protein